MTLARLQFPRAETLGSQSKNVRRSLPPRLLPVSLVLFLPFVDLVALLGSLQLRYPLDPGVVIGWYYIWRRRTS